MRASEKKIIVLELTPDEAKEISRATHYIDGGEVGSRCVGVLLALQDALDGVVGVGVVGVEDEDIDLFDIIDPDLDPDPVKSKKITKTKKEKT